MVQTIQVRKKPNKQNAAGGQRDRRARFTRPGWSEATTTPASGRSSTLRPNELLEQLCRITAESLCQLAELYHVQATLASLHLRHEALWLPQPLRELNLSDAGGLPRGRDEADQLLMPLREDR